MSERSRARRHEVLLEPGILNLFERSRAAWHETEEEIQAGLEWGKEKARLLRWVRKQMERRLTARERHCLELYFFEGLTYRQIGARTGTNASSALRAVQRSIRRLRACLAASRVRRARDPRA